MKKLLSSHAGRWALPALAVLALALLPVPEALARAGGGGGFHGGGFSGGGGGNGGGGDAFLIYMVIRLIFAYPWVGVPVALLVVGTLVYGSYQGGSAVRGAQVGRTIRRGLAGQGADAFQDALAAVKTRDTAFSPELLAERVGQAFLKVQDAWSKQDMRPVRHLLSDGVHERFTLQLEIQKASRTRNVVENLELAGVKLRALKSDQFFDTAHFRVDASAVDYFVDRDNGKRVSGSTSPEPFAEHWSFLRRPGAATLAKPGLLEGNCPNCGTLLELSDSTVCPSCSALVNSGDYDWVLAEITQEDEWNDRDMADIPGLAETLAKDPAFNVQHVEDRVSVMFHRDVAARFFADRRYVSKLACDAFVTENAARYAKAADGSRDFFADVAVGSVELVDLSLAAAPGEMDLARVKVKWCGRKLRAAPPTLIPPDVDASKLYVQEFVLMRHPEASSSTRNTLTSAHCPNCGSPERVDHDGHCGYCGTPLNDGSADWALQTIRPFGGYPALSRRHESLGTAPDAVSLGRRDNENIITCVVAVMLADGELDDRERQALERLAIAKRVGPERLNAIMESVKAGDLELPLPDTPDSARDFLRCMATMCLADGKVTSREKDLMRKVAAKFNFAELDMDIILNAERGRLYKLAKGRG